MKTNWQTFNPVQNGKEISPEVVKQIKKDKEKLIKENQIVTK